MKIKWLLEKDVFSEDLTPLKDEIVKQGFIYEDVTYIPFQGGEYSEHFKDKEECVIFYGSLNLAAQLIKDKTVNPYVYCTVPNYECTKYYAYFGEYLVNQNYVMLPFSELKRRKDWLFEVLGKNDCLFVRPSSGSKTFTGQLVRKDSFDKDYDLLNTYDVPAHAMVLVAEPQRIMREWRLIVADNKVISGSMYSSLFPYDYDYRGIPENVLNLANKILEETEYRPDPIWTMDICEDINEKLYLLEIGGFSCAGLYQSDMKPIVESVSRISWEKHII